MVDTCLVTGTIVAPDGTPLRRTFVLFQRTPKLPFIADDASAFPAPVTVRTDADGSVEVRLIPGTYLVKPWYSTYDPFRIVVPDEPAARLEDIQFSDPPPPLTDAELAVLQAREARDEARDARDEAEVARGDAQAAAQEAEAAADRAEAARDAAQLNAHIFPTTAAGLAATTDGDYFSVPSPDDDEYLILYRNSSGTAEEISRYPSSQAVEQVRKVVRSDHEALPELVYQLGLTDGKVLAEFQGSTGKWQLPGLDVAGPIESGSEDSEEELVYQLGLTDGKVLAEFRGSTGNWRLPGLDVGGTATVHGDLYVAGSIESGSEGPEMTTAPAFAVDDLTFINQQTKYKGDGSPVPQDSPTPPLLSTDAGLYGYRYAQLASSVVFTGNRCWVAAYGQNTRPGGHGEGADGFTFLLYCDNIYDDEPEWREVLYVVPDFWGTVGNQVYDPMLSVLDDGRLLVQVAKGLPTTCVTWAFIIDNPQALAGTFNIGRLFWLDYGVPTPVKRVGSETLAMFYTTDPSEQFITRLEVSDVDTLTSTRISTVPSVDSEIQTFYESAWVPISASRINLLFRTTEGHYVTTSSPGAASWDTPVPWTEYDSVATRGAQTVSPSGRVVRVWNNDSNGRNHLTVGLSDDGGRTFPHIQLLKSLANNPRRLPQYPCVTCRQTENGVDIVVSYDFGRLAEELGSTRLAVISEDKIVRGESSLSDVRDILVAETTPLPEET